MITPSTEGSRLFGQDGSVVLDPMGGVGTIAIEVFRAAARGTSNRRSATMNDFYFQGNPSIIIMISIRNDFYFN